MIELVNNLDEQSFDLLSRSVDKPQSFVLSDDDTNELKQLSGLSSSTISYLTAALYYVYEKISGSDNQGEALEENITQIIEELALEQANTEHNGLLADRLAKLLQYNPSHEKLQKIRRLEAGFIPAFVNVKSFVDLRPSFSKDRKSIDGYVPIVQLNISTDSNDPAYSSITIQLSRSGLEKLIKNLHDIEDKIQAVDEQGSFLSILDGDLK